MSKFKVGEIVECISGLNTGRDGEIINVGCILPAGTKKDYGVAFSSEDYSDPWGCDEASLRKKKPPEELSRWSKVEEDTGWSPHKVSA